MCHCPLISRSRYDRLSHMSDRLCNKLAHANLTIPRCPHCHQTLPYDQVPTLAAIKSSPRPPARLALEVAGRLDIYTHGAPPRRTFRFNSPLDPDPRRVHFALPSQRHTRRSSSSQDHVDLPAYFDDSHASLQPLQHNIPPPPPPASAFPPTLPTIYILSYSTDILRSTKSSLTALLASQLPLRNPPIPHLYTIDARPFTPPAAHICAAYSGIATLVQDIVLRDRAAAKAVKSAVQELVELWFCQQREGKEGRREVAMSVCCHAGTHRSVAVAERIAQGVKGEVGRLSAGRGEGARIVCRHVHRVRGRGDPF